MFWRHYFFRVKYIRLALGIEKPGSNSAYVSMKSLLQSDVLYEPTFEPPPRVKTAGTKATVSPVSTPASKSPKDIPSQNSSVQDERGAVIVEDSEVIERQNVLETRRVAEAALAAEVEAELDDDDIDLTDLGDLELGDDTDDFDDLGDLDDDDAELEAQIALELAEEEKK